MRILTCARQEAVCVDSHWPLYRLRHDASVALLGRIIALRGDAFCVEAGASVALTRAPDGGTGAQFPGLPWYLDELRPQGFLGRRFAKSTGQALGLPSGVDCWGVLHVLKAILSGHGSGAGDLVLGQGALGRALSDMELPADHVDINDRPERYAALAHAALHGVPVGGLPGGEQPKFTATVEAKGGRRAMLVKFAQPGADEAAERWSDLLVCEHLALQVLTEAGMDAACSTLLQTDTHTFLELERFDRTPDVLGRRRFVSLLSLSSAFLPARQHWSGPLPQRSCRRSAG